MSRFYVSCWECSPERSEARVYVSDRSADGISIFLNMNSNDARDLALKLLEYAENAEKSMAEWHGVGE